MGIERCFYFFFFLVAESTLLGSLVPSNATLPSKSLMKQIMADPKKFVTESSKVDPTELQNIITLLEGLLETSEAQEQDLVNKVDDETTKTLQSAEVAQVAQAAVEDAQADVEHAQAAVEDAQAALALKEQEHQAAQAALALKEQEHQAASDAHDAQEGAKAVAEQELADLEGGLNSEQEVIRQVIDMLQGLQGGSLPECENCVELDGRQFATMDFCPPDTPYGDPACENCQRDYLPLPDGWQLASSADTEAIAANHIFATHVIVAADGSAWKVKTFGSGKWGNGLLSQSGDTYKASTCSLKVLMMREA